MKSPEKLKDTLNLPKTDFPMRANAVEREPARMNHWENSDVYAKMQQRNADGTPFILHDGQFSSEALIHI